MLTGATISPDVVRCPYCKRTASLVSSDQVYSRDFGMIYLCDGWPQCDAYVGVHDGTDRPKGTLANAELRSWRVQAHAVFDGLWQNGCMTRNDAYGQLCAVMEMTREEAHIGLFTIEQCQTLIERLRFREKS